MSKTLRILSLLLIISPSTTHAQPLTLACNDGSRIRIGDEELALSETLSGQHANNSGVHELRVGSINGAVLATLLGIMRQLKQIRLGYAWKGHVRSHDLSRGIKFPRMHDALPALAAADYLRVDPLIIKALAREVAYKMECDQSTRLPKKHMGKPPVEVWYKCLWNEATKGEVGMFSPVVADEIYRQHLILIGGGFSIHRQDPPIRLSLEDVYEWARTSIVCGTTLEAARRHITELGDIERLAQALPNLEKLDLDNNKLREFHLTLAHFPRLREIHLVGNPIDPDMHQEIRSRLPGVIIYFNVEAHSRRQEGQSTQYYAVPTTQTKPPAINLLLPGVLLSRRPK